MRIGDVIALPVNPAAKESARRYVDAKVVNIDGECFHFEFIAGSVDGIVVDLTRAELDAILGREGGEEWKR